MWTKINSSTDIVIGDKIRRVNFIESSGLKNTCEYTIIEIGKSFVKLDNNVQTSITALITDYEILK